MLCGRMTGVVGKAVYLKRSATRDVSEKIKPEEAKITPERCQLLTHNQRRVWLGARSLIWSVLSVSLSCLLT